MPSTQFQTYKSSMQKLTRDFQLVDAQNAGENSIMSAQHSTTTSGVRRKELRMLTLDVSELAVLTILHVNGNLTRDELRNLALSSFNMNPPRTDIAVLYLKRKKLITCALLLGHDFVGLSWNGEAALRTLYPGIPSTQYTPAFPNRGKAPDERAEDCVLMWQLGIRYDEDMCQASETITLQEGRQ